MNILLDTHLAVWAINDDVKLTEKAKSIKTRSTECSWLRQCRRV